MYKITMDDFIYYAIENSQIPVLNVLLTAEPQMNSKIRLYSILNRYPEVESLISAYDVDPESDNITTMNIEDFCETYDVDLEDFLMDLEEVINDSKSAQWLGGDGDQWTEGFTEELEDDNSSFVSTGFEEESDDGMGDF